MNLTIFTVLLLIRTAISASLRSDNEMVCCIKEPYQGRTAVFTCADDPDDHCAQRSCEDGKSFVYTIEIIDCTFSELPFNVFDSYNWRYNIMRLNISNIGLESIEPDYFRSQQVWYLYASNNKLKSLSEGMFSQIIIEDLDLSKNEFDSVEGIAKTGFDGILTLNLSNNKIPAVNASEFTSLRTLERLDLSFNLIESIPPGAFEKLRNLKYLSLASNKLTTLVDNSFPNMDTLDLSHNLIDAIESAMFPGQLRRLIVAGNGVTELHGNTFNELTQLIEIDLSSNNIETIEAGTFWKLKQLKRLALAHNRFVQFEFWDLPISIEQIDVSFNGLQSLQLDEMTNLQKVQTFNVGSNNISTFSGFRRRIFPKLKYVDLTRNNMPCSELKSALDSFGSYELEVEIQPSAELENRSSYRGMQCVDL